MDLIKTVLSEAPNENMVQNHLLFIQNISPILIGEKHTHNSP